VLANGAITGTLKYIEDYSAAGFTEGGNFLALKVSSGESVDGVTYTVTLEDDSPARTVTLDSDQNVLIQVKDKDKLKITVKAEKAGYGTDVKVYTCKGLTCEEES